MLLRLGKSNDAIKMYDRAIELAPSNPAPYFKKGKRYTLYLVFALRNIGKFNEAF